MSERTMKDPPPKLAEIARYIEHRMVGKSGSVTLHYMRGRLETIQWGDREDSRSLVSQEHV